MPHAPLSMFQRRMLIPMLRPLTVAVGEATLLKFAVPCTTLHDPVATPVGALAAITAVLLVPQRLWSGPASAACASPSASVMVIASLVIGLAHAPLFTVHTNWLTPTPMPVMAVIGSLAFAMVATGPKACVHVPVAGKVTALPCIVVLVTGVQKLWSAPAFAAGFAGS